MFKWFGVLDSPTTTRIYPDLLIGSRKMRDISYDPDSDNSLEVLSTGSIYLYLL